MIKELRHAKDDWKRSRYSASFHRLTRVTQSCEKAMEYSDKVGRTAQKEREEAETRSAEAATLYRDYRRKLRQLASRSSRAFLRHSSQALNSLGVTAAGRSSFQGYKGAVSREECSLLKPFSSSQSQTDVSNIELPPVLKPKISVLVPDHP